jgi:hypothetical protein
MVVAVRSRMSDTGISASKQRLADMKLIGTFRGE